MKQGAFDSHQGITGNRVQLPSGPATVRKSQLSTGHSVAPGKTKASDDPEPGDLPCLRTHDSTRIGAVYEWVER